MPDDSAGRSSAPDRCRHLRPGRSRNRSANRHLYRFVQDELRAIAKKRKKQLREGIDLCTTALVNDAFLRVVGQEVTLWPNDSRQKFFSYVATAMHGMLIDIARAEKTKKCGGDFQRVEGKDGQWDVPQHEQLDNAELLLDLKGALARFADFADTDALIFRLRYFLGLTFDEISDMLTIPATSIKRGFERARAWLKRELKEYDHDA